MQLLTRLLSRRGVNPRGETLAEHDALQRECDQIQKYQQLRSMMTAAERRSEHQSGSLKRRRRFSLSFKALQPFHRLVI